MRLESLGVLVVLIVALSILSPYFLSVSNFLNILLATAVVGVLAFGATFVIGSAGIDLSVGSVLALSGVVMGLTPRTARPALAARHRRLPSDRRLLRPDQRPPHRARRDPGLHRHSRACSAWRAALRWC